MDSELRQDLVSGDWILIAPGRAKRPDQFLKGQEKRERAPKSTCLFEEPQKSGNPPPVLIYGDRNNWELQIIPNKFPAVKNSNSVIAEWKKHGPYSRLAGVGHHELVITRSHDRNFPALEKRQAEQVFRAFQERYRALLADKKYLAYISIFHNWGKKAGASIYHPHYQMISLPIIPPDVSHSLAGSRRYFEATGKCVHCVMNQMEKKDKVRIIFENKGALVYAPYVSRSPFELRIFPKSHSPYFEEAGSGEIECVVEALQKTLKMIQVRLNDPDYNFFIHTAPVLEKKKHGHYHWHIEIRPHIGIPAGFELSTGIDINVLDPNQAARFLKSK